MMPIFVESLRPESVLGQIRPALPPLEGIVFVVEELVGPVAQPKPWLLLENGQESPGPMLDQLLGLLFFRIAGSDSQSVQSM